jgi:hypothetical protein
VAASPDFGNIAITHPGVGIYMSSNSGVTWTAKTNAGIRNWHGIAATADFIKIAALQ